MFVAILVLQAAGDEAEDALAEVDADLADPLARIIDIFVQHDGRVGADLDARQVEELQRCPAVRAGRHLLLLVDGVVKIEVGDVAIDPDALGIVVFLVLDAADLGLGGQDGSARPTRAAPASNKLFIMVATPRQWREQSGRIAAKTLG